MRIAITGGAGFLGARLARELLDGGLPGDPATIREVRLLDLAPPPADLAADPRVTAMTGELAEGIRDAVDGADLVVHLAAVVSGAAEADFDLGMRANLDGIRSVLEAARGTGRRPTVVFASSLAVFGSAPEAPLPDVVDDDTVPRPQSSYGVQKLIGEHLVADYDRKGFIRGRSVRLQTVAVRPGRPNAAASGFVSSIVREPLAGLAAVCPVPPDLPLAVASPARTVAGLLRAATAADADWAGRSAVTLPGLTVTPASMLESMDRVVGRPASSLVDWRPDPAVEAIVRSWPSRFRTDRATRLGLAPDPDFDSIVRQHLEETA